MEFLDIYNSNGTPTGKKELRSIVHEQGLMHAAVHIYIFRPKEGGADILLQKRADNKDSFPSCWDTSCAGHVSSGDTFEQTAIKELGEELGITIALDDLIPVATCEAIKRNTFYNNPFIDHEIFKVYCLEYDAPVESFSFQKEEISQLKWMDSQDLLSQLEANNKAYCIMPDIYKRFLSFYSAYNSLKKSL